jgi:exosortase K
MDLPAGTKTAAKYAAPFTASVVMVAFKLYCEDVPASSLKWILGPISSVVEIVNGMQFTFREDGYIDETGRILLGTTCTGLSFMTITMLMSMFSFLPGIPFRRQMLLIPVLAAGAYILTVLANSSRIAISAKLVERSDTFPALTTGAAHEAQGVLYYLLFLLIYYFTLRYLFTKHSRYAPAA